MELSFSGVHWLAVGASFVAAQVVSTLWFTVIFGDVWAREYGAPDRRQHTKEVPGYTYAVQAACTLLMVVSLALLQAWLDVDSLGGALAVGGFVSLGFCVATGVPGQAFLKRWRVAALAVGSQVLMIMTASVILGVWR